MSPWLKDRLEIIRLNLGSSWLFGIYALLFIARIVLGLLPPFESGLSPLDRFMEWPWYIWTMGWLTVFWLSSIEYSTKRKEIFDQTSIAFFKAYLDHLIAEGAGLFNHSDERDFYSKLNDWQHRVIQGLAIGLGPEESQIFFQKMDKRNPKGDQRGTELAVGANDALRLVLKENLDELQAIRLRLAEAPKQEESGLEPV